MNKIIAKAVCVFLILIFSCGQPPKDSISVMTFNMYVGFDAEDKMGQIIEGGDISEIAPQILTTFLNNDPEERIDILAREIARLKPDFIGLQEVTDLSVLPFISVNFLKILTDKIKKYGAPAYKELSVDNIVLNIAVDIGGPFPLQVHYRDREVLLYRNMFKLQDGGISLRLAAHRDAVEYEGDQIIFYRGLAGGRFFYGGEPIASVFTTHLDQAYLGGIQTQQMAEILSTVEPYRDDSNFILMGDFNTEEGDETYGLIAAEGYTDTYRLLNPGDHGYTCCNLADLSNIEPTADQKIDLIFYKSTDWNPVDSSITLNKRDPLWPSDHFGVITAFDRAIEE